MSEDHVYVMILVLVYLFFFGLFFLLFSYYPLQCLLVSGLLLGFVVYVDERYGGG